jgi:hypothetical protein
LCVERGLLFQSVTRSADYETVPYDVPSLAPGASPSFVYDVISNGLCTLWIDADRGGVVDERTEANNEYYGACR